MGFLSRLFRKQSTVDENDVVPENEGIDVSTLPLDKATTLDGNDNMAENKEPPKADVVDEPVVRPRKRRKK